MESPEGECWGEENKERPSGEAERGHQLSLVVNFAGLGTAQIQGTAVNSATHADALKGQHVAHTRGIGGFRGKRGHGLEGSGQAAQGWGQREVDRPLAQWLRAQSLQLVFSVLHLTGSVALGMVPNCSKA